MRKKQRCAAVYCGNKIINDTGQSVVCKGLPVPRPVTLHYGEGRSVECCRILICINPNCRRPFKDSNKHNIIVGPFVQKAKAKYFNIPHELHNENWDFYYKFAWEIQLALDEDHLKTDLYADELIFKMNLRFKPTFRR